MKPSTNRLTNLIFFIVVFSSESNVWVRTLGGNTGLVAGAQASAFSSGNSDPVLLAMNVLTVAMTAYVCLPKLKQILAMLAFVPWLSLIYLLSVASIIWSVAPANTFRLSVYLIASLMQFVYIALFFKEKDQVKVIGNLVTIFAVLSIIGQFKLPPNDDLAPGWAGIFPTKNYLGNLMAIGITALFVSRDKARLWRYGKIAICFALLVLSQSFTALVGVIITGTMVAYMRSAQRLKQVLIATVGGGAIVAAVLIPNLASEALRQGGKDTSFTGRDVIWAFSLREFKERPILGYGYQAFWLAEGDNAMLYLGWNPGQAHNGFIELMLEEGAVGLLLLLIILGTAIYTGIGLRRRGDPEDTGLWCIVMVAYLIAHNVAEADFYERPAWVVFLIAFITATKANLPWQSVRTGAALVADRSQIWHSLPTPEPKL